MLAGRADAPDATLLRALAAAQLDAATRPTISFLHVSAAGGTSAAFNDYSTRVLSPPMRRCRRPRPTPRRRPRRLLGGQEAEEEEGARGAGRTGGVSGLVCVRM